MTDLYTAIYGTCCGVGYLAISSFLAVVLLFLLVSVVGVLSDALTEAIDGASSARRRAAPVH
ncbi:MAG: hypothetical protein D6760_03280 [Deltaproteobacteria bacterium]|nr:MAG: hypothetical protein D6760_03280 [Deltaproteobacteria bacterium]